MTVPFTQLGFYVGHGLELAGVVALGLPGRARPAPRAPRRGRSSATSARPTLVAQEEAFLGARVRALLVRLGEKDAATEGHTRRVAMLAVQVGEALGPARAAGCACSRSAGCCTTSASCRSRRAVLQKPGPLDDDEFAEIRKHPEAGERLLRELGGFAARRAAARARPPRAARRLRLPARAAGERARRRDADPRGLRRLRRARLRPRLPLGLDAGARARACCATEKQFDAALRRPRSSACCAPPFVADVARRRPSRSRRGCCARRRGAPEPAHPAPAGCGAVGSSASSPSCSRAR